MGFFKSRKAKKWMKDGDDAKARRMKEFMVVSYIEAAKLNCAEAEYKLAECFEYGILVEKDLEKARKYYRFAEKDGHKLAKIKTEQLDRYFNNK